MKKAKEILKSLIPIINMQDEVGFIDLFSTWGEILGDEKEMINIAAHSEPVDMKNGVLIVYVDHPGWLQRIELSKKQLLERIHERYAQVSNIFVQKVNNEMFLQRREARIMGNKPPLAD